MFLCRRPNTKREILLVEVAWLESKAKFQAEASVGRLNTNANLKKGSMCGIRSDGEHIQMNQQGKQYDLCYC